MRHRPRPQARMLARPLVGHTPPLSRWTDTVRQVKMDAAEVPPPFAPQPLAPRDGNVATLKAASSVKVLPRAAGIPCERLRSESGAVWRRDRAADPSASLRCARIRSRSSRSAQSPAPSTTLQWMRCVPAARSIRSVRRSAVSHRTRVSIPSAGCAGESVARSVRTGGGALQGGCHAPHRAAPLVGGE